MPGSVWGGACTDFALPLSRWNVSVLGTSVFGMNVDTLKAAAKGRWPEILAAVAGIDVGLLDGKHHPCPKCGGSDRWSGVTANPAVGVAADMFVKSGAAVFLPEIPELQGFNFTGGINLKPELVALLIGLSAYTAAFIAEVVRAGILSVSQGQTEAG